MDTVQFRNGVVAFKKMRCAVMAKYCPLCGKLIPVRKHMYMVITNNNLALFPNVFIHKACCDTYLNTAQKLYESWQEAKKYWIWFKDEPIVENQPETRY